MITHSAFLSADPTSQRPLRVSNGYIDIDNIRDPPGEDFENWIEITKQKLRERESKLMSARISALQNIIKEQCAAFESAHSSLQFRGRSVELTDPEQVLHSGVIEECLNKLSQSLQFWRGVNLSKTKKALSTFREYFVIGKCWFDQKKKSILAPDFWIKILCVLDRFAEDAAASFFQRRCPRVERLFCEHLRFQTVSGIFSGQLHFAETKPQPLIPCSIIKDSRSMKEYLLRLHRTLNVDRMIKENKPTDPKAKTITAMKVLDLVNKQLADLRDSFHVDFQREFQALPHSVCAAPPPSQLTITPSSVPPSAAPFAPQSEAMLSATVPMPFQMATGYPITTAPPYWHSAPYKVPPPVLPDLKSVLNTPSPTLHRVPSPPSPSTASSSVGDAEQLRPQQTTATSYSAAYSISTAPSADTVAAAHSAYTAYGGQRGPSSSVTVQRFNPMTAWNGVQGVHGMNGLSDDQSVMYTPSTLSAAANVHRGSLRSDSMMLCGGESAPRPIQPPPSRAQWPTNPVPLNSYGHYEGSSQSVNSRGMSCCGSYAVPHRHRHRHGHGHHPVSGCGSTYSTPSANGLSVERIQ